jgi:hypothetical protein
VSGRGSLEVGHVLRFLRSQRVEIAPTPGRRVYPNTIPATLVGADTRASLVRGMQRPSGFAATNAVSVRERRERISLFASFHPTSHNPLPVRRKLC